MAKQNLDIILSVKGGAQAAREMESARKSAQGMIDTLKKGAGESSALGEFAKMARGAGAVAGLAMAAKGLENVTARAVEMRNALDAGKTTAGELPEEIVRAVPYVGSVWSAGRGIRELVTGQGSIIEEMNKSVERTNKFIAARSKLLAADADVMAAWGQTAERAKAAADLAGLGGFAAARAGLTQSTADARADMADAARRAKTARAQTENELVRQLLNQAANSSNPNEQAQVFRQIATVRAEGATVNRGINTAMAQANAALMRRESAARSEIGRQELEEISANQRKILQLRQALNVEALKAQRQGLAAELSELRNHLEASTAEIVAAAEKRKRGESDATKRRIDAEVKATLDLARQASDIQANQIRERYIVRERSLDRELESAKRMMLEEKAAFGDVDAQLEAMMAGVVAKWAGERDRLSAIINDDAATAGQRERARQMMGQLSAMERTELESVRIRREWQNPAFEQTSASGLLAAARERQDQPLARVADNTKVMADVAKETLTAIRQLVSATNEDKGGRGIFE